MVRRARKAAHSTEGARVSADVSAGVGSVVSSATEAVPSTSDEVVPVQASEDIGASSFDDNVPEGFVLDYVVDSVTGSKIPGYRPVSSVSSPVDAGGASMADIMSDDTSFASDVASDDSFVDTSELSVSEDEIMASFPDPVAAGVVDVTPASVPATASAEDVSGCDISAIVADRSGSRAPGERVSMSQLIAERSGSFVRGSEVAKMSASDIIKSRTFTGGGQRPSAVIRSRVNSNFSELDGKCHTKIIG